MKAMFTLAVGILFHLSLVISLPAQEQPDPAGDKAAAPVPVEVKGAEASGSEAGEEIGAPEKIRKRVFGKSDEASFQGKVVVIKVGEKDLVNKQAFKFWRRVIKRVNDDNARAVVFDIDTPGGLAFDPNSHQQ